jgi:hypothetical protein
MKAVQRELAEGFRQPTQFFNARGEYATYRKKIYVK